MVHDLGQRLQQGRWQITTRHAHPRWPPAVFLALELLAINLHDKAGQLSQMLAQTAAVARQIGNFVQIEQLAHAQCTAGQLINPLQAAHVHLAGKLRQGCLRQVVGFVEDEQAVIQVWQQACAQAGKQQIMIGNNDLRGHHLLAALVIRAVIEHRAVLAGAGAAFCSHGAPGFRFRWVGQAVAVAIPLSGCQRIGHGGIELHARFFFCLWACTALLGGFFGKQVVHFLAVFT